MTEFQSLKGNVSNWSLDTDEKVLSKLDGFLNEMLDTAQQMSDSTDIAKYETNSVSVYLHDTFNALSNLSNKKFIENGIGNIEQGILGRIRNSFQTGYKCFLSRKGIIRVKKGVMAPTEIPVSTKKPEEQTPELTGEQKLERYKTAIRQSLTNLNITEREDEPGSKAGTMTAATVFKGGEGLPFIIGSRAFYDDQFMGIVEKNEEVLNYMNGGPPEVRSAAPSEQFNSAPQNGDQAGNNNVLVPPSGNLGAPPSLGPPPTLPSNSNPVVNPNATLGPPPALSEQSQAPVPAAQQNDEAARSRLQSQQEPRQLTLQEALAQKLAQKQGLPPPGNNPASQEQPAGRPDLERINTIKDNYKQPRRSTNIFEQEEEVEVGNQDLFGGGKKNKNKFDDILSGPGNPFNPMGEAFDPFGNSNPLLQSKKQQNQKKDDLLLNSANLDTIEGSKATDSNPLKAIDEQNADPRAEEQKKKRLTKLFEESDDDDETRLNKQKQLSEKYKKSATVDPSRASISQKATAAGGGRTSKLFDDDEDNAFSAIAKSAAAKSRESVLKKKPTVFNDDDDDEGDFMKSTKKEESKVQQRSKPSKSKSSLFEDDENEDQPLTTSKAAPKRQQTAKPSSNSRKSLFNDDEDEDAPLSFASKKQEASRPSAKSSVTKKPRASLFDGDEEEEESQPIRKPAKTTTSPLKKETTRDRLDTIPEDSEAIEKKAPAPKKEEPKPIIPKEEPKPIVPKQEQPRKSEQPRTSETSSSQNDIVAHLARRAAMQKKKKGSDSESDSNSDDDDGPVRIQTKKPLVIQEEPKPEPPKKQEVVEEEPPKKVENPAPIKESPKKEVEEPVEEPQEVPKTTSSPGKMSISERTAMLNSSSSNNSARTSTVGEKKPRVSNRISDIQNQLNLGENLLRGSISGGGLQPWKKKQEDETAELKRQAEEDEAKALERESMPEGEVNTTEVMARPSKKTRGRKKITFDDEDEDDDQLAAPKRGSHQLEEQEEEIQIRPKAQTSKTTSKPKKSMFDDDDDDVALPQPKSKPVEKPKPKKGMFDDDDDDVALPQPKAKPVEKPKPKKGMFDDDDDDIALPQPKSKPVEKPKPKKGMFDDDDDDDVALPQPKAKPVEKPKPKKGMFDDDDDDVALPQPKAKPVEKPKPKKGMFDDDDDDVALPQPKPKTNPAPVVQQQTLSNIDMTTSTTITGPSNPLGGGGNTASSGDNPLQLLAGLKDMDKKEKKTKKAKAADPLGSADPLGGGGGADPLGGGAGGGDNPLALLTGLKQLDAQQEKKTKKKEAKKKSALFEDDDDMGPLGGPLGGGGGGAIKTMQVEPKKTKALPDISSNPLAGTRKQPATKRASALFDDDGDDDFLSKKPAPIKPSKNAKKGKSLFDDDSDF